MDASKEFIGGLVKFAREYKKMERAQVVKDIEMTYQNLWDVENGIRALSGVKLDLLIKKMGMTIDEFWDLSPAYVEYRKNRRSQQN